MSYLDLRINKNSSVARWTPLYVCSKVNTGTVGGATTQDADEMLFYELNCYKATQILDIFINTSSKNACHSEKQHKMQRNFS